MNVGLNIFVDIKLWVSWKVFLVFFEILLRYLFECYNFF